jgi:hypothetical protein
MNTPVYDNVRKLYAHLLEIFEEGKAAGEMKQELNPYAARDIFVGTMDHIVTRWLLKDMSYSLFENLDELFDMMVDAFRSKTAFGMDGKIDNGASGEAKEEVRNESTSENGGTQHIQGIY